MDEDLQVREGIAEGFILNMHPIRIRIKGERDAPSQRLNSSLESRQVFVRRF